MNVNKIKRVSLVSLFSISILFNAAIIFIFLVWYQSRLKPFVVDEKEMRDIIKELSWNSASTWRVISHDEKRIVIEYRLPFYQITRYELPAKNFMLDQKLIKLETPFMASFDECDIYSRPGEKGEFTCMKFRDLSPKDCPELPRP
jgi:hypothetical protein